jgi:signal transduction histidine kinase
MPNGGKLNIHCSYDKEIIQIEVSDTGTGMSQEVISHAFDPFFSAKSGGTGLGLTNVKRIIELHNGKVDIDSVENQGTKVTIKLRLG